MTAAIFSLLTYGRVCSRSAVLMQAWHCSRSIAAFITIRHPIHPNRHPIPRGLSFP